MSEANYPTVQLQFEIHDNWYLAQTFKPVESHDSKFFSVKLGFSQLTQAFEIALQYTTPAGWPTGIDLALQVINSPYYQRSHAPATYLGQWKSVRLIAGIEYALVVRKIARAIATRPTATYEAPPGHYPRGKLIKSIDNGSTWDTTSLGDLFFAEWGDPPLPPVVPPPPLEHFAVLDFQCYSVPGGVKIRIPTSVPCRLTCYWTDKQPLKHHTTRTIRGLTVPWGTYFCFVAWHTAEQLEPLNSLYHTFWFIPWPACETRWLTFRASVDTVDSPSVGPIFECHRPEVTLPVKFQHYEDPLTMYASMYGAVWYAQIFTPEQHHIQSFISLLFSRSIYTWPTLYIEIRPVENDRPSDLILASGSASAVLIPQHMLSAWITINHTDIFDKAGTKYAIVAHSDATSAARLFWWGHYPGGAYARGVPLISTDGGNTWRELTGADLCFQEWGYPLCPE